MSWLYDDIAVARKFGAYKELPQFIKDNLNPIFSIRPYQEEALRNFITYYETPAMHEGKNIHTLFHMATGSGKTLIMAGLIVYLYSKGYRNFLFFVNLGQIVKKTIDNFMNSASSKYLFGSEIKIDGRIVHVNQVTNFQDCNKNDINILFDTTAGLHSDLTLFKENMPTFEDFLSDKTVLIADEAHHLNAATLSASEQEKERTWQHTIDKIRESNKENIMLEFTATCDVGNPLIAQKYQDKIIFDYNLARFRADKYSKDILTLQSDFNQTMNGRWFRSLQALIVSQYKLKRFQEIKLNVKPVVLFKSEKISESKENKEMILEGLKNLSDADIKQIRISSKGNDFMKEVFAYFDEKGMTTELLINELKQSYNENVCIDINDDAEAEKNQIIVNSLEDSDNPYRLLFEVKKLDEGWDCLNLFDIVRLYETRDSKNNRPGKSTVSEAQLIGRGARYFPFEYGNLDKYKRKFDNDVTNPYRVCEQLHYHCENNNRYITELNIALKEFGITDADDKQKVHVHNDLKDSFKKDSLYLNGFVFLNSQENKHFESFNDIDELKKEYAFDFSTGTGGITKLLEDGSTYNLEFEEPVSKEIHQEKKTIANLISEISYNFVHSEICRYSVFNFDNIKRLFSEIDSIKTFITDTKYLGQIVISITSNKNLVSIKEWHFAISNVIAQIANQLSVEKQSCNGSKQFKAVRLRDVFKESGTDRNYIQGSSEGDGQPQSSCGDSSLRFDLQNADWYVYKDNYGTTEEKKFVKYFAEQCIPELIQSGKYTKDGLKLIRNECQARIYDFSTGNAFEPDYLLFLKNSESGEYEYTQVFVEPKGRQLLELDKWKENFLLQLKDAAVVVRYKDDSKYRIWGLHFYCQGQKDKEFAEDIKNLCSN